MGGELVTALAEATGAAIIPVDSEHSALHQLLGSEQPGTVERLILTASGGPFRGRSAADLEDVSVEQALAHPTWTMGGKITIDSATLMNKGLELIEAHHLFGTLVRRHRRHRPPPVDRPQPRAAVRRGDPGAPRLSGHACPHLVRPALSPARRRAGPAARIWPSWERLRSSPPTPRRSPACAWPARPASAGGRRRARSTPPTRWLCTRSCGGRLRFLQIAEVIEETLGPAPGRQVHSFDSLAQPTPRRGCWPANWWSLLPALERPRSRACHTRVPVCPTSWPFWASPP